jgi:hypothetical protein
VCNKRCVWWVCGCARTRVNTQTSGLQPACSVRGVRVRTHARVNTQTSGLPPACSVSLCVDARARAPAHPPYTPFIEHTPLLYAHLGTIHTSPSMHTPCRRMCWYMRCGGYRLVQMRGGVGVVCSGVRVCVWCMVMCVAGQDPQPHQWGTRTCSCLALAARCS